MFFFGQILRQPIKIAKLVYGNPFTLSTWNPWIPALRG
jgi:hypothetical protein